VPSICCTGLITAGSGHGKVEATDLPGTLIAEPLSGVGLTWIWTGAAAGERGW
jgi:hypothetical protein